MPLYRLLYRSDCALLGSTESVAEQTAAVVAAARSANEAAGLTGALFISAGVFVQALEGPLDALEATFERICCDLRHRRVRLLEFVSTEHRLFAEWAMVEVKPMVDVARLCPGLDAATPTRLDTSTAAALIQTMRTILLVGTTSPGRDAARPA